MRRLRVLGTAVTMGAVAAWATLGFAEEVKQGWPADMVAHLARAKEIYVATVRKDGSRSTVAPVWFEFMDGAIWFATSPTSHKARRVSRGSPMFVSVNGKNGPFVPAKAEAVQDPAMADRLGDLYAKKYWIAWLGLFRPSGERLAAGKIVLLKLTPAPATAP